MNDRQMDLIRQIVSEQLNDYLAEELADDIMAGIDEGLNDNMALFEMLATAETDEK